MKTKVTAAAFLEALGSSGLHYARMHLSDGYFIIVTEYWGKIFGPFKDNDDAGALWLSDKVTDPSAFQAMVAEGDWCIGGDRVWLAPEVQYNITDRFAEQDDAEYRLPAQIDPGNYALDRSGESEITLAQHMEVPLYNTASGTKKLRLVRSITPLSNPLRNTADARPSTREVSFSGYTQEVVLTDLTPDKAMTEMWNLIQLHPGGTVLVPTAGKVVYQNYYEPIARSLFRLAEKAAFFKITGADKYKVGLRAIGVFGRIGYYIGDGHGMAQLIVRCFNNNPSFFYIDEPINRPGSVGDSVQIYNDDGGLGGFGEIEVHGCAVGGGTGKTVSRDVLDLWCFAGPEDHIREIAYQIFGTKKTDL
jgi:hypothetical protein